MCSTSGPLRSLGEGCLTCGRTRPHKAQIRTDTGGTGPTSTRGRANRAGLAPTEPYHKVPMAPIFFPSLAGRSQAQLPPTKFPTNGPRTAPRKLGTVRLITKLSFDGSVRTLGRSHPALRARHSEYGHDGAEHSLNPASRGTHVAGVPHLNFAALDSPTGSEQG